ncbi:uncharacterized protein DUF499 [Streptomyces sp. Ag109_G2-6]|uniref:DUF499 domain-containing protein n=1 Tax=Streptomyces TaxID=1883 RepID=UPI000F4E32D5|nr:MULTISPECIES: DUF499 domain-containing protein [Streptomyces]RPF40457.1 uncharacterized protein DUF499 [Streptomyces sp. Ag109_G2-6]
MTATTPPVAHWADVLTLRDEVRQTEGSVGELQMSLAKAVYQTVPVPYADCGYYTDITQPTPKLVGFLGRVARRLGVSHLDAQACFHLDQGMGGGKSHALVGIWHMISRPDAFFASELGLAVSAEAGTGQHAVDLSRVLPVILTCDGMSPGKTDPRFGPATDLFGRFIWLLFADSPNRMDRYQHYSGLGANKATLQAAFAEVDRPVLVLVDELMDYAMALTDESAIGGMPGEQAFLNALTDAVDDQAGVALVLVMIKSEEDQSGYHPAAVAFRDYLSPRLQRNGETVTVTEPSDFAQIIRRRLFTQAKTDDVAVSIASAFTAAGHKGAWKDQVYAPLGSKRTLAGLSERVTETYPFHPDLFALVSKEWTVVQAFQRVRSTVSIFARTALFWSDEHKAGRWAPALIGVGDIPLHTSALEALLSSGVLAGNDRAIQGYRAVATTDIVNTGAGGGTAFVLDAALKASGVDAGQPVPALRMGTACLAYSLVPRPRAVRGATKAELLAAVAGPGVDYSAAEEVFNALVASPAEGGLGALERSRPGRGPERFYLSIKQTLNMYHANALSMVSGEESVDTVWVRAQALAEKHSFTALHKLARPEHEASAAAAFAGLDSQQTRLVVLDPRRWTLLNGRDQATRADIDVAYGISPGLPSTFAASMVMAVATTQRRDRAKAFARDYLAWNQVVAQLAEDSEELDAARERRDQAGRKLDEAVAWAFQHYAFVLRTDSGLAVQYKTLPEPQTSLSGRHVWAALVADGRAVQTNQLSAEYVAQLITSGQYGRDLTPKELFAHPYSDPTWPLIQTDEEMRLALFKLATSDEWMLTDSDGVEIRPATAAQIQSATLQQQLRPRLLLAPPEQRNGEQADTVRSPAASAAAPERISECGSPAPGSPAVTVPVQAGRVTEPSFETTVISIPLSSVTDPAKREQVWHLLREVASLVDPAKSSQNDLQMVGLQITISAATGETQGMLGKASQVPGSSSRTEQDDF